VELRGSQQALQNALDGGSGRSGRRSLGGRMTRRRNSKGVPLAERMYFVRERGLSGWIQSERTPVLWVLSSVDGFWFLRDARETKPNDWVLPFLQFPRQTWYYQLDGFGASLPFVKYPARFPSTPAIRTLSSPPVEAQVLAVWEQVELLP